MASIALWKLRRLAARSRKVLARHGSIASIAAYRDSLEKLAQDFIDGYDGTSRYDSTWRREMAEGKGALAALLGVINEWKPHLGRENPSFDLSVIGDKPGVPEDLIEDGQALRDGIAAVRKSDGSSPAWAAEAVAQLEAALAAADKESTEASDADAHYTKLSQAMNTAADAFDAELQRFRKTLHAKLGRSHPDFQKLRAEKAASKDDDDDGAPAPS